MRGACTADRPYVRGMWLCTFDCSLCVLLCVSLCVCISVCVGLLFSEDASQEKRRTETYVPPNVVISTKGEALAQVALLCRECAASGPHAEFLCAPPPSLLLRILSSVC